ncbi:MAG: hypothetical protein ING19_19950 [Azospirillum sp.]|nr:hypothetical protein [Azospirillum sp.]
MKKLTAAASHAAKWIAPRTFANLRYRLRAVARLNAHAAIVQSGPRKRDRSRAAAKMARDYERIARLSSRRSEKISGLIFTRERNQIRMILWILADGATQSMSPQHEFTAATAKGAR